MIDIETLIEESNPVSNEVLPTADSPKAQYLLAEITAEAVPSPEYRTRLRRDDGLAVGVGTSGRRLQPVAAMALTVVLVGAGAAVLSGITISHGNGANGAPSWKLVGDITQASWSESRAGGYEPGGSFTCPTETTCYVEDSRTRTGPWRVEVTNDGGATWQQSTLPAGVAPYQWTLSCVDANNCAMFAQDTAGSYTFVTTDDGGLTWTSTPVGVQLPATFSPIGISCTPAESCVAVFYGNSADDGGGMSMVSTDGGLTWSDVQPIGIQPLGIECFASGSCIVTGKSGAEGAQGAALYSTDGGTTWEPATMPVGIGEVGSLSCDNGADCLAITPETATGASLYVVIATTDGGATWLTTGDDGMPPEAQPFAVACASSAMCWAGGSVVAVGTTPQVIGAGQSLLAKSTDSGQSWQASQLPASLATGTVVGVSCPDATTCYAMEVLPDTASAEPVLLSYRG